MTSTAIREIYRPIRKDIIRHLSRAQDLLTQEEIEQTAEQLAMSEDGTVVGEEDDLDKLMDLIMFGRRESGERLIDRYLATLTDRHERAFVRRMSKAVFTVLRVLRRRREGGIEVEDAFIGRGPKWLMDEGLAKSTRPGMLLAMRVFDAGPFLAGFGIITPVSGPIVLLLRGRGRPPGLDWLTYSAAIAGLSLEEAELLSGVAQEDEAP